MQPLTAPTDVKQRKYIASAPSAMAVQTVIGRPLLQRQVQFGLYAHMKFIHPLPVHNATTQRHWKRAVPQ